MKVFGIGHSRSGTTSLNRALNILGFPSIHFPLDNTTYWQLLHQVYKLDVLKKYDGITDSITIPFYKFFDKIYPNSKFILTYRDSDKWFKSLANKFNPSGFKSFGDPEYRIMLWVFKLVFGDYCAWHEGRWHHWDEKGCKEIYQKHYKDVKEYFKDRPNDLLIIDISTENQWEKLCPFLEVDIPKEDFPWVHKVPTIYIPSKALPVLPWLERPPKLFI